VATFVFTVKSAEYDRAIFFDSDVVVARSDEVVPTAKRVLATVAADLAVPAEPRHIAVDQWVQHLWPDADVAPQRIPGQHVAGLKYGDVNMNGAVTITDAANAANIGVGNLQCITGTDTSPNARDCVLAGNVVPANEPGNGGPGDLVPPGQEANGSFITNVQDASAIANETVGNLRPIVGDVIPGRESPLAACAAGTTIVPAGNISTSTTWDNDHCWQLNGIVRVNGGATLTIEAGTTVMGNRDTTGIGPTALFIEREGMIDAQGTRALPIIFTCTGSETTKFKGCWGGLWIAGWAPINEGSGTTAPAFGTRNPTGGQNQAQGEGNGPLYGGGNADDNSGVLRYAIIEYAGFLLSANNELNGLTLGGVGRGTTLEYIQVRNGQDDGIEFFGGTVNMRYVVLTGNSDDNFDGTQGFNGSAQFVIVQQNVLDADKVWEWDNAQAGGATANNLTPRTTGFMYNFTVIGGQTAPFTDPSTGDAGNAGNDLMHIRKGSRPTIRNSILAGAGRIFRMDDPETCISDATGTLTIESNLIVDYGFLENSNGVPLGCASESAILAAPTGNAANVIAQGTLITSVIRDPLHGVLPDFRLTNSPGTLPVPAVKPVGNTFIQDVTFIGAVRPGGDVWFAGWTRGFNQTSF
jgi:hypothetical protein